MVVVTAAAEFLVGLPALESMAVKVEMAGGGGEESHWVPLEEKTAAAVRRGEMAVVKGLAPE